MIQTLTIDIINEKALNLIKDLENLKLLRVRKDSTIRSEKINWTLKYKGSMNKQHLVDIDTQLNELRNSWD